MTGGSGADGGSSANGGPDGGTGSGGVQERLFRALLHLYPGWFRAKYGDEMTELFLRRLGRARQEGGGWTVVHLWWRTLGDAFRASTAVHRHRRGGRTPRGTERREDRMDTLWQDVRNAVRRLVRSPGFAVGAVVLLAVGIGVNASVFTVADSILFRPPPWDSPERVVHVYQDSDDGEPSSSSFPAARDMAESDAFEAVAAVSPDGGTWEGPDGPTRVALEFATSGYMDVLGMPMARGRWFGPEDDVVGAAPTAVVSHATWRTQLGGDPDVVGRVVRIEGHPVTVIGVGPEQLTGTYAPLRTDFWLSIASTVVGGPFRVANLERRQDHWYDVRARLAPGVTVPQAQAAMDGLAARLAERFPELNRGRDITVFPSSDVRIHPSEDDDLFLAGGLLTALAAMVLLVTVANLANLLLVRGLGRTGEMAVRRALGARRGRVARLFLIESLLLSLAGGAAGVLLAVWVVAVIPSLPIPWPGGATIELAVDGRVILFSLGLMAVTGVLFGLAPALRTAGADVASVLRDDRSSVAGGRRTARLRNLLVGVQVAASLVLVLGTGLLARSLVALETVETGVDAERVAYVRADFGAAELEDDVLRQARWQLLDRVRALPGVEAAGATSRMPAQGGGTTTTIVEGYSPAAGTEGVELPFVLVSDGYFEALGVPLVAGRRFETTDGDRADNPAILINQAAADRFWPGQDPVGRRMRGQGSDTWRTVVGVVGNTPVNSLGQREQPVMYFTDRAANTTAPYIVARVTEGGRSESLVPALRRVVEDDPHAPALTAQGTLASHFGAALQTPRFGATLMAAFAVLAVVLAGLGIYAVVAFSVARRTAELGIRMALGAGRGDVIRMVVRDVALTVALGLGAGVAVALPGTAILEGALYGVSTRDPVTFAGAVVFILLVAAAAAWLPARRAARTDPAGALRVS